MARHLRADSSVLMHIVRLTHPDSPPTARGVSLHTKRKMIHRSKALITHMVVWSKLTLLSINCTPKTLARRPFYEIGQQRNFSHALKQNGPKGNATSIAYSSHDVRILSTRLLIVGILSYSNVEWYDDEPVVHT